MKRIFMALCLAAIAAGCMPTRPEGASGKSALTPTKSGSRDTAAEQKLSEKLPLVTPESVTAENVQTKLNEFDRELLLESQRLDSARNVASAGK